MALAVKIRALLWGKLSVRRLHDLIGQQGRELLDALFDPMAPEWLRSVRQSNAYGRCGYKITIGLMMWFGGVLPRMVVVRL
jgi:hypothetical protein